MSLIPHCDRHRRAPERQLLPSKTVAGRLAAPRTLRKRRMSQFKPIRFVRNPVTPPPMLIAGSVLSTGSASERALDGSLASCQRQPTKYGRSEYSARRRGSAITTLPVSVFTLLSITRLSAHPDQTPERSRERGRSLPRSRRSRRAIRPRCRCSDFVRRPHPRDRRTSSLPRT